MRYTRNYKLKKDKGNQRGTSIQGPFTTLEQVLKRVPVQVGFNIECKYPMIDECEQEEMEYLNVELNWWVDTGKTKISPRVIASFHFTLLPSNGFLD
jgi:glycerophosphodiester phosphodiesterase